MIVTVPNSDLESYDAFLQDAREHLGNMEDKILCLEGAPDTKLIDEVFRGLHSIKGVASFLHLTSIQKLGHKLESVFDSIRQGKTAIQGSLIEDCLKRVDVLKSLVEDLAENLARRKPAADDAFEIEVREWEDTEDFVPVPPKPEAEPAAEEPEEMALITPEMRGAFTRESLEQIEEAEQLFLDLEKSPENLDLITRLFRLIHSFKGNSGFFGYGDMEKLSHGLESVLEVWKEGGGAKGVGVMEPALKCLDALRQGVAGIASGGSGSVPELAALQGLLEGLPGRDAKDGEAPKVPLGQILVERGVASEEDVKSALEAQRAPAGAAPPKAAVAAAPIEARKDLRVDVGKLDQLLDLVGELVIASSIVRDHPDLRRIDHENFDRAAGHLGGIVTEFQNVVLGLRMVPVQGVFKKMVRLVHDQCLKSGKQAKLELSGEKTEVDKNIAELIADPLVHMIRNAIDHGVEPPEERAAAGKPPIGTVTLEARQEGGDISIALIDDGRGLNRARILAKAKEKGLLKDGGDDLRDDEVFQFIFMPGFSTAEQVTATSGRGVGMDVVKSNIEKLRGKVSIRSVPGKGTSIDLRIPLTLSITEGMQVRVGQRLYMLPLSFIRETLSPDAARLKRAGDEELFLLRNQLYPVLRLAKLYDIPDGGTCLEQGILLLIETRERKYCLFVDELMGMRQTVVKALPPFLGNVKGASGCSILPSGEICLILDLEALWAN